MKQSTNIICCSLHLRFALFPITAAVHDHKEVYDDSIPSEQQASHSGAHHLALVQSNSTTANVERTAAVSKKPLVKQSTFPYQKDLHKGPSQPFSYLTTTQPTQSNAVFLKETSVFKEQMTRKKREDVGDGHTAQATLPVTVTEERRDSVTLPESKHPTIIDEDPWRNAFSTFSMP